MRPIRGTLPPTNTTAPPPSSSPPDISSRHQPNDSLGKTVNNSNNNSNNSTTTTPKKAIVVSGVPFVDTSQSSTTVNTLYSGRYSSSCPPNAINSQGIGGGNSSPHENGNNSGTHYSKMNYSNANIGGKNDWGHHRASAETAAATTASAGGFSLTIENEAEATRRCSASIHAGRPSAQQQQQQQQFSYSASLSQISDATRDIVKRYCPCCCSCIKNNNTAAVVAAVDDICCCHKDTATRGGAAFLSNIQTAKRSRRLVLIFTLVLVCVIFAFDRWNSSSAPSSIASSTSRSNGIKHGGVQGEEALLFGGHHDEPSSPRRGQGSHRNRVGTRSSGGGGSSSNNSRKSELDSNEEENKKEEKIGMDNGGHRIVRERDESSSYTGEPTIFRDAPVIRTTNPPVASEREGNNKTARKNPLHLLSSSSSLIIPEQHSNFFLGASSEQALDPRYVDTHHLILVAGHAVFKGIDYTAWANPSNWAFESWQREMPPVVTEVMVQTYAAHIKKGLETMLGSFEELKQKYSTKRAESGGAESQKHDEEENRNSSPSPTQILSNAEQQQQQQRQAKQKQEATSSTAAASVKEGKEEKAAEGGEVAIESKQRNDLVAEMLSKRQRIKESILLFSGGQSRSDSGPRSEGLSYYMIALAMNFFNVFDSAKGLDLPLSPLAALIEKLKESTGLTTDASSSFLTHALAATEDDSKRSPSHENKPRGGDGGDDNSSGDAVNENTTVDHRSMKNNLYASSSLFGESSSKLLPLLAVPLSSHPPHPSSSGPHHSSLSTFLNAWGKLSANEQQQIISELEKRLRAEALEPHIASEPVSARILAEQHIFVEDFARDSYENLLFSVARFHEITGKYPKKITVVGFEYKRERFESVHREAIRFPAEDFSYIGVDYVEAAVDAGIEIPPLQQMSTMPSFSLPEGEKNQKDEAFADHHESSEEAKKDEKKGVQVVSGGSNSDDSDDDDENDYDEENRKEEGILAALKNNKVVGNRSSALREESVGGAIGVATRGVSSSSNSILVVQQKDEAQVAAAKFLRLPSDANTIAYVKKDVYLCSANAATRRKRNPQHRVEPYQRSAPQMEALLRHCGPELFDGPLPWRK